MSAASESDALDGSWETIHVTATCGDGATTATDETSQTVEDPAEPPVEEPADISTGELRLQLAFVVYISVSMWYHEFDHGATIVHFVTNLVDDLEAAGVVVEYSLVTYGSDRDNCIPQMDLAFTGDADAVKSGIQEASKKIDFGREYMYWAAMTGLQQDWDSSENTTKVMIVISDEDADDGRYRHSLSSISSGNVITIANQRDVTIYGVDCSADELIKGCVWAATQDLNKLANGTEGQVFTEMAMYDLVPLLTQSIPD